MYKDLTTFTSGKLLVYLYFFFYKNFDVKIKLLLFFKAKRENKLYHIKNILENSLIFTINEGFNKKHNYIA